MVHNSEHLLVVHAPLLPGRLVLCAVIRGMLLCDSCDCGFHWYCVLGENHRRVLRGTWHCPGCRPGGTLPARRGARAHGACATAGAQ
jgi:hypothetical protein